MEDVPEAKYIGIVEGLGEVYQTNAPLHKQILSFQNKGIKHPFLVTPEEVAMIRLAGLSSDYTRTCVAPVGVEGEKPIFIKPSIFMDLAMAEVIAKAHSENSYPTQDRVFYEALKERANRELSLAPENRIAQTLSSTEDYNLTPEMDDARFLFGKSTAEYFKRFNHPPIRLLNLPVSGVPEDKCIVNYLWFVRPEGGSVLGCGYRDLYYDGRAFGVLRKSAEGTSQNYGYSLTNVENAVAGAIPKTLEEIGLSALKDLIAGKLEENVLEILRIQ